MPRRRRRSTRPRLRRAAVYGPIAAMPISARDPSALPSPAILKRRCAALARLDRAIDPDADVPTHDVARGGGTFWLRESEGNHVQIAFMRAGVVILGFDHESPMSPTNNGERVWPGLVDALPSGTVLRFGGVRIRLTLPCEVCHRLERVRPGLARAIAGRRGVLGRVLDDGALAAGQVVVVERRTMPALDDDWRARVVDIVRHVPRGQVVTTTRLVAIAGVQVTYCRALPAVLRRAAPDVRHRRSRDRSLGLPRQGHRHHPRPRRRRRRRSS